MAYGGRDTIDSLERLTAINSRFVGQPEVIRKQAWRKSIVIFLKPTSGKAMSDLNDR
jgi:hypothetical protein